MDDHDSFWDPASFRLDATPFSDYDTASGSGAGTWPLFSPWIPKRPVVTPEQACLPLQNPPPPYEDPERPYKIALVERGGCDFATKVRAAQDRGASGVIVGDGTARDDESDEEGMQRENLITMFSPGRSFSPCEGCTVTLKRRNGVQETDFCFRGHRGDLHPIRVHLTGVVSASQGHAGEVYGFRSAGRERTMGRAR